MKRGSIWLVAGLLLGGVFCLYLAKTHATNDSPSIVGRLRMATAQARAAEGANGQPQPGELPSPAHRQGARTNPLANAASDPVKRPWDRSFLAQFSRATTGDRIRFELVAGEMASGPISYLSRTNGQVMYLSGELTEPEPGRFFFQKQTRPGVAGDFVGIVEFPGSQRAYRIEPSGPGGAPELVERRLGEVLCQKLPRPVGSVTNAVEQIPPLNPANFPTVPIPGYQNGISPFESLHGATAVVYLDFQGGSTPTWGGVTYSPPGDSNDQVREVWRRVSEDFMPFNINVTTDLKVFQNAPQGSRQHVIITPTATAAPDAGGVAYVGSFNWTGDTPCWVFESSGKACAEACSHEIGHTLSLTRHETQDINGTHIEYYAGQGLGETAWAPIMGVGYYRNVSQWAHGEYLDAGNLEDELAMIVTHNNEVAYRPDDTGDTLATSRYLEMYADYTASAEGVIERTADTDAFQFTTSGGEVSLRADPVSIGPDLALAVSLYDANDVLVVSNCPQDTLSAALDTNLAAGTYTFRVTGTGRNDPLTNGFSSYASLGYYSITGSVANARLPDRFALPEHSTNGTVVGTIEPRSSAGDPITCAIVSGNIGNTFALNNAGVLTVGDNSLLDYSTLASHTQLTVQFELFVDLLDQVNPSLSETNRRVVVAILPVIMPPVIIQQPQSLAVAAGGNASFRVGAMGGWVFDPLNYQWFFNESPLVGATSPSLLLQDAQATNAGDYMLTITNSLGAVTSVVATLSVTPTPPSLTLQPSSQAVLPGLTVTFSAAAVGTEPLSFQWQFNGVDLPYQTSQELILNNVQSANTGNYSVVVSNSAGTTVSQEAELNLMLVMAWGANDSGQTNVPPTLTNVVQISAGAQHNLALLRGGEVVAWGSGEQTNIPTGLTGVVAVAAGGDHSLALKNDGSVVAWGVDNFGQADVPAGLSNVVAVAAGFSHNLALQADGTVAAWGDNSSGQSTVPSGLRNVIAIAAGPYHSLALRGDETVIAWGNNTLGQTTVPINLSNVVAIAAGQSHNLALKTDETISAWGFNDPVYNQAVVPGGLFNVIAIAAGDFHSLALDISGHVTGWGAASQGSVPIGMTQIAGIAAGAAHSLVMIGDGAPFITEQPMSCAAEPAAGVAFRVTATGSWPLWYQWLLNGTNLPGANHPALALANAAQNGSYQVVVSNAFGIAISRPAALRLLDRPPIILKQPVSQTAYLGSPLTLQVTAASSPQIFYQWRFNGEDIPGATNATLTLNHPQPNQSGYFSVILSNALGAISSAKALVTVVQVAAWAGEFQFQNPTNIQMTVPVGLSGVLRVSAGAYHSLALKSDGTVAAWAATSPLSGSLDYGQTAVPPDLTNTVAIAAGRYHSLALSADGTVRAWGAGASPGAVGFVQYGQSMVPAGLDHVVAIAAGDYHSVALKSDGTLAVWGGQFGSGLTNVNPLATSNIVAIASSGSSISALRADGVVYSWGGDLILSGYRGVIQITSGAMLTPNGGVLSIPTAPAGLSHVVQISGNNSGFLARRDDGTTVQWGTLANGGPPLGLNNALDVSCAGQCLAALGDGSPIITEPPHDFLVPLGGPALLSVLAAGAAPLSYQWQLNGSDLPGATNAWFKLAICQASNAGFYSVRLSNVWGVVTSKSAQLTVLAAPLPLGPALDATNLVWKSLGNAPWFAETNITLNGLSAAQSGRIGDSQQSTLQAVVSGPGTLSFWWKVSSEQWFDTLSFAVNAQAQATISGEVDWELQQFSVPPGNAVLSWTYAKDPTLSVGQDAGWLAQVAYATNPPAITQQPLGQIVPMGSNVVLNVVALGAPPLAYQWLKNGTNLAGAAGPSFSITNSTRQDSGTYAVAVSNPGGTILSSNAAVLVQIPQLLGPAAWLPQTGFTLLSRYADRAPLVSGDLANFEAQASSNLSDWTTLTNSLELTNGALLLVDPSATNYVQRFYRIIER